MILYIGMAVIMILIQRLINSHSVLINTVVATALMLLFIFIANKRDKFISVYLGKTI